MKRFLLTALLLAGCATSPPPDPKFPCKLYQPPRGFCAYNDPQ